MQNGKAQEVDYITIEPGQAITGRVNIADSYDWPQDGYYYIRVKNEISMEDNSHEYLDVMRTVTKVFLKNTKKEMERRKQVPDRL